MEQAQRVSEGGSDLNSTEHLKEMMLEQAKRSFDRTEEDRMTDELRSFHS